MALTVVPTPIGNLGDITLRALETLRGAELIACEDTRRTRALLAAHGIPAPRLVVCDERQEERRAPELVEAARRASVVLVSDAGMPAIADPGRHLLRAALAAGVMVTVLPGASSVETALVRSGLARDAYAFRGWVPRRPAERARFLAGVLAEPLPAVLFDSPRRVAATLADVAAVAPEREVALCRELTKLHEEVLRGRAADVAAVVTGEVRGEVVLVLDGAVAGRPSAAPPDVLDAMRELTAAGLAPSRAAAVCSRLSGVPRRLLYEGAREAASSSRQLEQTGRP